MHFALGELERRIVMASEEIHYIKSEIAKLKGRKPPRKESSSKRRRPKVTKTLTNELEQLNAMRAFLHAKLIKLRGDPVFSHGFEKLEKLGLIAAPINPMRSPPGRPSKYIIGPSIRLWMDLILRRERHQITVRKAGAEVEQIIRLRHKKTFLFREQDYYAEKRRIEEMQPPFKTRVK